MRYLWMICFVSLFTACHSRQQQATAYIIQRRIDQTGKLVLNYRFHADDRWVSDSIRINNQPVPDDTLKVIFASDSPAESRLQIP